MVTLQDIDKGIEDKRKVIEYKKSELEIIMVKISNQANAGK